MTDGRLFSIGALVGLLAGGMAVDPNRAAWPLPILYVVVAMLVFGLATVAVFSRRK